MKPLEFMITKDYDEKNKEEYYTMIFFYENGDKEEIYFFADLPKGIELNKHYSITDTYGYTVIDDRKGL